mmetsp:Transcript_1801/g.4470  ORF Transcript_1801/g.4470 Transcript_1801/m.4470 type:complete len:429 (-) Transcript_1801:1258-2544(-)
MDDRRAGLAGAQRNVARHTVALFRVHRHFGLHPLLKRHRRAAVLKLQDGWHQPVAGPHVHDLQPVAVAERLLFSQLALHLLRHLDQPLLVDEGQQADRLPGKALAVEVQPKRLGVKVQQRRLLVLKQPLVGLRQRVLGCRRQHAHQLVERLERRTQLELHLDVPQVADVRRKGRVVVRVVPVPRGDAVIVVAHHPAHALHVAAHHVLHHPGLRVTAGVELLRIVALAPAGLREPDLALVLDHRVKHVALLLHALVHLGLELRRGRQVTRLLLLRTYLLLAAGVLCLCHLVVPLLNAVFPRRALGAGQPRAQRLRGALVALQRGVHRPDRARHRLQHNGARAGGVGGALVAAAASRVAHLLQPRRAGRRARLGHLGHVLVTLAPLLLAVQHALPARKDGLFRLGDLRDELLHTLQVNLAAKGEVASEVG